MVANPNPNSAGHSRPALTAVVITASIGRCQLKQCVESVQAQTYAAVEHVVVADGAQYSSAVAEVLQSRPPDRRPLHVVPAPFTTGMNGMNGYRIYAAMSHLVNADVVMFLDDDNWFDATHVEACMATLNDLEVDWAFALRRICREDGTPMLDDDCDSIGHWRRAASYEGDSDCLAPAFQRYYATHPFLVDTSCFAVRRPALLRYAPVLLHAYWGDSLLACNLIQHCPGATTGDRTVNYRLRIADETRLGEYYARGNRANRARHLGLPWTQRQMVAPLGDLVTP